MPLTPKRERFVAEYLVDLNATKAAIRAGYSERTANREGSRLLSIVDIQEAIKIGKEARKERTEVTQDMVVEGLLAEARLTDEGSSHSARVAAWAHLGKHLGMFVDKHELSGRVQVDWDSVSRAISESTTSTPDPIEQRIAALNASLNGNGHP